MSIIVIVQVLLTFVGGKLFSCTPFGLQQWLVILGLGVTIIPVDLFREAVINLKHR